MGGVYKTPAISLYPILSQAGPAVLRMGRKKKTTNQNENGINAHFFIRLGQNKAKCQAEKILKH